MSIRVTRSGKPGVCFAEAVIRKRRQKNGMVTVTWVLPADVHDGPVSVVGCFNNWTPGMHVLGKRSNGTRSVSWTAEPGTQTKFRYLGHGGRWFNDPDVLRFGDDSVVVADLSRD
ncbi:isoamylase [Kibdelosporangium aridum]|uniref:isoamylase n=1 Tax=Kibdelosporangium aridum TaxID=2030 RepID=UPI002E1507EF